MLYRYDTMLCKLLREGFCLKKKKPLQKLSSFLNWIISFFATISSPTIQFKKTYGVFCLLLPCPSCLVEELNDPGVASVIVVTYYDKWCFSSWWFAAYLYHRNFKSSFFLFIYFCHYVQFVIWFPSFFLNSVKSLILEWEGRRKKKKGETLIPPSILLLPSSCSPCIFMIALFCQMLPPNQSPLSIILSYPYPANHIEEMVQEKGIAISTLIINIVIFE